ncbi:hypothetical protein KM043_011685 [Ampulex compressa]|nr:hypothetical protein KM043_011685 [Ampulex compressa]
MENLRGAFFLLFLHQSRSISRTSPAFTQNTCFVDVLNGPAQSKKSPVPTVIPSKSALAYHDRAQLRIRVYCPIRVAGVRQALVREEKGGRSVLGEARIEQEFALRSAWTSDRPRETPGAKFLLRGMASLLDTSTSVPS